MALDHRHKTLPISATHNDRVAPSEAPSLTPEAGYDSAAEAGQTGPGQFAVGLALFGAGLTVLLADVGVPALRRRRAVAHARATRSE